MLELARIWSALGEAPPLAQLSAAPRSARGKHADDRRSAPAPRAAAVDVVLAAPSKEWAQDVERRLGDALPKAEVRLGQPGERLPDTPPPSGFTVRCEVLLPKAAHGDARDAVLRAFHSIGGLEINYSEPIDLIVVAPG